MKYRRILFSLVPFCVVVFLFQTASAATYIFDTTPTHNLTMGERKPDDILLFNKTIKHSMYDENSIAYQFYRCPKSVERDIHNITKFQVEDMGLGGKASLYGGGIGKGNIQLLLESQEHKGFKFQLVIYGYKRDKQS